MNASPTFKPSIDKRANVIDLTLVKSKFGEKSKDKHNKSEGKRHSNKVAGVSSEVYPFTSEEEIKAMIDVFDVRIENTPDENKKQIACRNKMLFLIGINVGLRASDLITLKWNFFFDKDGNFKDSYTLQPKKTRKAKKFVKLYFNQVVKKAVTDYIEQYPIQDMDEYLFKSRKGDGHITEISLGRIIKDAAEEAGIERNICSHSLRKTFGYHIWHNAQDKEKSLIILQTIFNHSSPMMTKKYIGLMDDEIEDVFQELNLGGDFI